MKIHLPYHLLFDQRVNHLPSWAKQERLDYCDPPFKIE